MKRETLLEKGYTEEQVSELLNEWHEANASLTKENEKLKSDLGQANETISGLNQKVSGLSKVEQEYNAIKQSQLSDDEKRKIALEEAEKKEKMANLMYNNAIAKQILSEIGIADDKILSQVVREDEKETRENATNLLNLIKSRDETIEKTTTEKLTSIDNKPNPSNNLDQDGQMTWEKFDSLSADEQNKFAEEHPDEFAKL